MGRREDEWTSPLDEEGIPELQGDIPSVAATGDTTDGLVAPGDQPKAVDDRAMTAAGQREGGTLSERLDEEEPERDDVIAGVGGEEDVPLVLDDAGAEGVDRVGELTTAEAGEDHLASSPEDAAMSVTDEPPGAVTGPDDYVIDDGSDQGGGGDEGVAKTRGGSNVPRAGKDPSEGRHE